MTCGLVHATCSYSLPKWQAVKLTFFAPWVRDLHQSLLISIPYPRLYSLENNALYSSTNTRVSPPPLPPLQPTPPQKIGSDWSACFVMIIAVTRVGKQRRFHNRSSKIIGWTHPIHHRLIMVIGLGGVRLGAIILMINKIGWPVAGVWFV